MTTPVLVNFCTSEMRFLNDIFIDISICFILSIDIDPYFDDSNQCWHGFGFRDCNIIMHIQPHGCKWYHFFPQQTFEEHVEKFNEITNNVYAIDYQELYSNQTNNSIKKQIDT